MSFDTRANTPAHALAFTPDAVHLLRREGARWLPLGQARFDDPAMREALENLRHTAGTQSDLAVRVMIPDDQILYTDVTIDTARPRSEALMRALEGLTPYEVVDLAWDYAETDEESRLRVAAVARETLTEAEEFARTHGFAPDSFGALPGTDRFPHEPRFGEQHPEAEIFSEAEDGAEDEIQDGTATEAFPEDEAEPENLKDTLSAIATLVREGRATRTDDALVSVAAEIAPEPEVEVEAPAKAEPDLAGVTDPVAFPDDRPAPVISRISQHVYAAEKPATPEPTLKAPALKPVRAEAPTQTKPVPPRAQALLARAAEARASRESRPETQPQRHAPAIGGATRTTGHRRQGLQGLGLPVGALLVGLAAAWILLPGREAPEPTPQPAAVTQAEAPVVQPEPAPPTPAQSGVVPAAPLPVEPVPVEPAPVEPSLIEPAPVDLAPTEVTQAEPQPTADPAPPITAQPVSPAPVTAPETAIAPEATATAAQPSAQASTEEVSASAAPTARPENQTAPQSPAAAAPAPTVPAAAPAPANTALSRSARPTSRAATRAQPPVADAAPRVPEVPAPFAERATRPLTASRPNARPSDLRRVSVPPPAQTAPAPAATPAPASAPAPAATNAAPARPAVGASNRPRPRPPLEEGSAAEPEFEPPLTTAEQQHLRELRLSLQYAQAGGISSSPPPRRRPGASVAGTAPRASTSASAIEGAVAEAVSAAPRSANAGTRSARPPRKPASINSATGSGASVNDAVAAAMAESAPGSVGVSALSSKRPARRSRTIAPTPEPAAPPVQVAAAPIAPPVAAAPVAVAPVPVPNPVPQPVPLPETRSVTIAPTPQPKVESRQIYVRPPEADDEPDDRVASAGSTSASVARTATQRGVLSNRTTLIGIYGSGRTARGLIRTSNGRFVKVKLGDRLDGGIVNSIGNGQLTYVKNGQQLAMRLLDGR